MGKKYLETKKDTLESSVLGVWKVAIEEGEAIKDAAQMIKKEVDLDEKHDTHVDPKDRDELDNDPDAKGGSETAKKMKKAKEPEPGQMAEASGDKEAYKKFFDATLKKFKVNSPAELKGDDKKKFFDYIDKGWEGDNEKAEELIQLAKEFKVSSMREALAKVWGFNEGELPPALKKAIDAKKKDKEEKNEVHDDENGKTLTGKKTAKIDIDPDLESKK